MGNHIYTNSTEQKYEITYVYIILLINFCFFSLSTKIFIRSPRTLFATEDAFQAKKHNIATIIQKIWKGRLQRQKYLKMREAAIIMEKWARRFLAKKEAERRHKSVNVIRK
jgi:myosin-1